MRKFERRKRRLFKRKIRNIICIVLMIILIFNMTMVDAGSNDSKIEKNRIDGIYAVTNIDGINRIFYLNMYTLNGRVSYCIELGVDISSDIYNSTYDFNVSKLNEEEINYIKNISYFGYGYDNHNDIEYYMAVQEIIWEYLGSEDVYWVNVMDVDGERINIDSYKEEIVTLVDDYDDGVNLENYVDNMSVIIGEELVLRDINDNLKYYDVVWGENCYAEIVDDNLHLKFNTNYVGNEVIKLIRKKVYDYDTLLYYQGDSQKLISNGNVDDVVELKFEVRGQDIKIQLRDSVDIAHNNQFNYSGILYELFSEDYRPYGRFESDKDGKIVIKNMPYGRYYIRGIGVNRAYYFDKVKNYFNFFDDNIIYLEVHPVINNIKILKLYGDENNLIGEEGVIFEIYNKDGSFYDDIVTDKDGVGAVDVPYGEYIIKQKNSSYGYKKVEDFSVDARKKQNAPISYTLLDEMIKTNLVINAINKEKEKIVEEGISYRIKINDEYIEVDGKIEFNGIDGIMKFPIKLGYGDYVIEIINNSKNFRSDVEKIEITINDNSDFFIKDNELCLDIDINFVNKLGKVKIKTLSEEMIYVDNSYYYDYKELGNVKVSFVANEDIVVNGNVVYKNGDIVDNFVTDVNGEYLLNELYFGSYCLVMENERSCFEINSENELLVKLRHDLDKGSVIVHNLSSDLENIMGTSMELYNNLGQVIYIGVTNEEGIINIKDLRYGDYCVKERSVKEDYLLNEDKVCFSINKDEVVKLEVINKKVGKKIINVPNTFSNKKSIKKFVLLFVLLLFGGIIYKIKISNKISQCISCLFFFCYDNQ